MVGSIQLIDLVEVVELDCFDEYTPSNATIDAFIYS